MKELFRISKPVKILISVMIVVVIIGIAVAYLYYSNKNKVEDPRVIEAKKMLVEYDILIKEKNYSDVFPLLDSVQSIYLNVLAYRNSFETGIVYNNRAATMLLMALYENNDTNDKIRLLDLAKEETKYAIIIYEDWLRRMDKKTESEIRNDIEPFFNPDDIAFRGRNVRKIIDRRVAEIIEAQLETKRRLSVSYTNLGIIQRHQLEQEEALKSYEKALLLWKDNHTARNNLNVLLGRPVEDRTILEKLFPPERLKE